MKRLIAILLTIVLVFTLASCKEKEVSISFETNQSSITLDPITIKKDESLDLSTYTDRMVADGYVFKGWYLDKGFNEYVRTLEAVDNITVYAKWAKIHTVSFDTLEGTTIDSQRVEDGKIATEPLTNPTKTGFYFDGWYSDSEYKKAFDFYQEIKADTTIYAKWLRSCEVTFVTTGSAVSSLAFVEGRSAIQFTETSTKPGYDFAGWFKDQAYTTVITSTQGLTTSISVYAKFTPHTYTLTYNRNGGSGTNKTVNTTYDTDIILAECTYTKAGYSFKEWNTKDAQLVYDANGDGYPEYEDHRRNSIYKIYEKASDIPEQPPVTEKEPVKVTITVQTPDGKTASEAEYAYKGSLDIIPVPEDTFVTGIIDKDGKSVSGSDFKTGESYTVQTVSADSIEIHPGADVIDRPGQIEMRIDQSPVQIEDHQFAHNRRSLLFCPDERHLRQHRQSGVGVGLGRQKLAAHQTVPPDPADHRGVVGAVARLGDHRGGASQERRAQFRPQ